jgi:hypothetical protein
MKRELYDFTTPPDVPKEVVTTMYYFPHQTPFLTAKPSLDLVYLERQRV